MKLQRVSRADNSLFGVWHNRFGEPLFVTVENWVDRIPAGRYPLRFENSPRFGAACLTIAGVKGRVGIRVHAANWAHELEGCIAPGMSFAGRGRPGVRSSRVALERLRKVVFSMPHSERFLVVEPLPKSAS